MRASRKCWLICTLTLLLASPAEAYIGPGIGAGAIALVLGVLTAIGMAFVAILWYPLKRLLKLDNKVSSGRKGNNTDADLDATSPETKTSSDAN